MRNSSNSKIDIYAKEQLIIKELASEETRENANIPANCRSLTLTKGIVMIGEIDFSPSEHRHHGNFLFTILFIYQIIEITMYCNKK